MTGSLKDEPVPDHDGGAPSPVAGRPVAVLSAHVVDLVEGGLLLGLAAWFWVAAGDIDTDTGGIVSPASFPRGLAALLGTAALLLVVQALWRMAARDQRTVRVAEPFRVVGAIGLTVAFPVLMSLLGYYPAMGAWLVATLWVLGYRKPFGIALYAGGFLAFTKVVFEIILKTPV